MKPSGSPCALSCVEGSKLIDTDARRCFFDVNTQVRFQCRKRTCDILLLRMPFEARQVYQQDNTVQLVFALLYLIFALHVTLQLHLFGCIGPTDRPGPVDQGPTSPDSEP